MKFIPTSFTGLTVIQGAPINDHRGTFLRTYCKKEFLDFGLSREFVQSNLSINKIKGTIRGMHAQIKPNTEAKLIRCVYGRVFDVAVDLRISSPTFLKYFSIELSAQDFNSIYIPEVFVHGFQVLEKNSILIYNHTSFFNPSDEFGIRYDDPIINIQWPLVPSNISNKDLSYHLIEQNFQGLKI